MTGHSFCTLLSFYLVFSWEVHFLYRFYYSCCIKRRRCISAKKKKKNSSTVVLGGLLHCLSNIGVHFAYPRLVTCHFSTMYTQWLRLCSPLDHFFLLCQLKLPWLAKCSLRDLICACLCLYPFPCQSFVVVISRGSFSGCPVLQIVYKKLAFSSFQHFMWWGIMLFMSVCCFLCCTFYTQCCFFRRLTVDLEGMAWLDQARFSGCWIHLMFSMKNDVKTKWKVVTVSLYSYEPFIEPFNLKYIVRVLCFQGCSIPFKQSLSEEMNAYGFWEH